MARVFYDKDGRQLWGQEDCHNRLWESGHAQALNLKDSGLMIVANRKGSANYHRAVAHGFDPAAAEAAPVPM